MAIGLLLAVLVIVALWCWLVKVPRHRWAYAGPFERICKQCARHEIVHRWCEEHWGWWDVFSEGDGSCERR